MHCCRVAYFDPVHARLGWHPSLQQCSMSQPSSPNPTPASHSGARVAAAMTTSKQGEVSQPSKSLSLLPRSRTCCRFPLSQTVKQGFLILFPGALSTKKKVLEPLLQISSCNSQKPTPDIPRKTIPGFQIALAIPPFTNPYLNREFILG